MKLRSLKALIESVERKLPTAYRKGAREKLREAASKGWDNHTLLVRVPSGNQPKPTHERQLHRLGLETDGAATVIPSVAFRLSVKARESVLAFPISRTADHAPASEINLADARQITIAAAPWPNTPGITDATLLVVLGVNSPEQTGNHILEIQFDVESRGFVIDGAKIATGPSKSVGECAESINKNAKLQ